MFTNSDDCVKVPPPLDEFVEFTPSLQQYKPILWLNDYWNLNRDYQPINSSTPSLNLSLTFQPLSMFKWQMYSAQQLRNRWTNKRNLALMQNSFWLAELRSASP